MKRRAKVWLAVLTTGAFAVGAAKVAPARSSSGGREWKAPSAAAERKSPVPPNRQSALAGRGIYERECASCHGTGGKGDGKDGMDLEPLPADLSSPPVADQTEGALFWKVSTGRRPMPGFRKGLTEEERWQVVGFIRTLGARK